MLRFGKKGIIALLVTAVMMAFTSGAMAADVADFEALKNAFNTGGTYKLTQNITISEDITTIKNVVLDLNGHTVDTIEGDWKNYVSIKIGDGKAAGDLTLNNTVPASGGIIFKTKAQGSKTASAFIVQGNSSKPVADREAIKSTLTVNEGVVITSEGYFCLRVFGKGATLNVLGGKITSRQDTIDSGAITGNGNPENGGTVINISGGTIAGSPVIDPDSVGGTESSGGAIYHPQIGVLNISGGTLTGYEGVQLKAGTFNMTGGTIRSTGAAITPIPNHNGSVATGSALSLITCYDYLGDMSVSISGTAKLESTGSGAYAIYEQIIEKFKQGQTSTKTKLKSLTISGGTFKGTAGALKLENMGTATVYALTGGSYSSNPKEYVNSGYAIAKRGDMFVVEIPAPAPTSPDLPADKPKEVQPVTPVVTSVDIEAAPEVKAKAVSDTAALADKGTITATDLEVSPQGLIVPKEATVKAAFLDAMQKSNKEGSITEVNVLPVFSATLATSGDVAAISYSVKGSDLKAAKAGDVRVIKVLSSTTGDFFTFQSDSSKTADKNFALQPEGDKKFLAAADAIAADKNYKLLLFVKDNGDFDLCKDDKGKVVDPAAIAKTTEKAVPTPTPTPTPTPAGGSSSSGCNAGVAALALLGFALVPVLYRKKR
ncbi:MAG: Synerg-CTERM sorting domain-containing protein [Cloacibacillus sp.]